MAVQKLESLEHLAVAWLEVCCKLVQHWLYLDLVPRSGLVNPKTLSSEQSDQSAHQDFFIMFSYPGGLDIPQQAFPPWAPLGGSSINI